MARSVPEWVGRTPDTWPPPDTVKLRIVLRQEGKCAGCGAKFDRKVRPQFDHIEALIFKGRNAESNIQALCVPCHAPKSASEVTLKAKRDKNLKEELGVKTRRSSFATARGGKFKAKIGGGIEPRE